MNPGIVMIGALLLILFVFVAALLVHTDSLSKQWTVVMTGVYDSADYGYFEREERSGAMVHTTHYRKIEVTVIRFEDGRTHVMSGRYSMPFPKGSTVRVHRNGLNRHRLEKL